MKVGTAVTIALLLCGAPAGAAEVVLGNGVAHDCFTQAMRARDAQAGIAICGRALDSDVLASKDRAATLINRGILRTRAKDASGALSDFAAALALRTSDDAAYLNRSAAFIALERYAEALDDANRAIALGAQRLEIAYYNRGVANEELGNIGAAFEDYKAALRVEPRFAAATAQLRRFRVVSDDPKGT
ncbi:MAG TPA: hypothetical protein VGC36_17785 [Rhizomicrobium sp.]